MIDIQSRILNMLKQANDPGLRTIRSIAYVMSLEERKVETALLQLAAAKRVRMRREDGKEAWQAIKTPSKGGA